MAFNFSWTIKVDDDDYILADDVNSLAEGIQDLGEYADAALALLAPKDAPTFTGVPAAPTAAADTNTTQIATTAFVLGQASDATPAALGVAAAGASKEYSRGDHVHAPPSVAQGGLGGGTALPATTGTMTATIDGTVKTITPTGACTFNASGGVVGQRCTFIITTSGTSSFTLTFSTNFKVSGTLATGTTSGKVFAIDFVCKDGTLWVETGRTAAM